MPRERWTVLRALQWTRDYLQKKAIPNPRLEGELLLSHVLGIDRVGLYLRYDMILSPEELKRFRRVIERRTAGEPLQYITGFQEFWSIRFKVSPAVLIPRPETEVVVEEALRLIGREGWQGPRILEVGTGCGAIAVSIATSCPSVEVVATEVSWDAIVLARQNAAAQGVLPRVHFVQADLLSFARPGTGVFELIVSNPPYIKTGEIRRLQREIRDFEPKKAIDGGRDGLDVFRRLVLEAPPFLRTGGWVVFEIGEDQGREALQLMERAGGLGRIRVLRDFSGRDRAAVAQKA